MFDKNRAISWSSYYLFKFSPEKWYLKYVLKQKDPETPEMAFGKELATHLENGTCTIKELTKHLTNKKEHPFKVMFGEIPIVGFADDFCDKSFKKLNEVKTGKKAWTQKRVDEHGQFNFYLLMNFITNKIKPEDVECKLFWLPTQGNGDFTITFVEPLTVHIFNTKRTTADILKTASDIKATWKEMEEYVKKKI